jgi:hypothetical protein
MGGEGRYHRTGCLHRRAVWHRRLTPAPVKILRSPLCRLVSIFAMKSMAVFSSFVRSDRCQRVPSWRPSTQNGHFFLDLDGRRGLCHRSDSPERVFGHDATCCDDTTCFQRMRPANGSWDGGPLCYVQHQATWRRVRIALSGSWAGDIIPPVRCAPVAILHHQDYGGTEPPQPEVT